MKILVLAGGADQCALINELKNRGAEVILLDYLPNPPAKSIVNKHIQESTLDPNAVKKVAIDENVDIICTACTDQALLTVANVSEELGLPCYISYKQALEVTNKSYMKTKMIDGGIPTSSYHILKSLSELDKLQDLSFPLVIKPADCNSSKGVIKVNNASGLKQVVETALDLSRSHTAIVEEFVEGEEISADFYIKGDTPILLGASNSSKIPNSKGFTIIGSYYKPLDKTIIGELLSIAAKISKVFMLKDTPLLIQLIRTKDQFSVIEFSARMGGGSKYRLIQEMSGVNIMEKYIDLILGQNPDILVNRNSRYIKMVYVYTKPGVISKIEGLEGLKEKGTITEFFIYKTLGSCVEKAETSSDRSIGIMISANTLDDLNAKIKEVNAEIKVIDDKGNDIIRHDLIR